MPCDLIVSEELVRQKQKALADLFKLLALGKAKILRKGGRLEIEGWKTNRVGWRDACALNKLMREKGWQMKEILKKNNVTEEQVVIAHGH